MNTLVYTLLAALAIMLLNHVNVGEAQVVTCGFCNGTIARCKSLQKCCNGGLKNAACTPNADPCADPVQCNQVSCGTSCGGATVWCPVGQVCCNACPNRNLCTPVGGSCDQANDFLLFPFILLLTICCSHARHVKQTQARTEKTKRNANLILYASTLNFCAKRLI